MKTAEVRVVSEDFKSVYNSGLLRAKKTDLLNTSGLSCEGTVIFSASAVSYQDGWWWQQEKT